MSNIRFMAVAMSALVLPALAHGVARNRAPSCWLPPLNPSALSEFNPEVLRTVKSIEDLPRKLGPLRENWTLAYQSRSTQTHDYRVISFAPGANAIVAFTGCNHSTTSGSKYPSDAYPECENAEVMKFQSPREEVELSIYKLPGKVHSHLPVVYEGVNPERCTGCHGNPPMPRFEPYNTWPGFFGSRSRDGEDVIARGSNEHRLYQLFLGRIFSEPDVHRRYFEMRWRPHDTLQPQDISQERLAHYVQVGETPLRIQHSAIPGPNPELNKMLGAWRARMMIKKFVTSSAYPKMKNALMALSLQCDQLPASPNEPSFTVLDFLPANLRDRKTFEDLSAAIDKQTEEGLKETRDLIQRDNPLSNEGRYRLVGSDPTGSVLQTVKGMAYLWQLIGNSDSTWNVSGHSQRYNFNDGRSAIGPIFHTFIEYVQKCDTDLIPWIAYLEDEIFAGVHAKLAIEDPILRLLCRNLATGAGPTK